MTNAAQSESRLYLTKESRAKLIQKFGVTPATLSSISYFKFNSVLQREIRRYAINIMNVPFAIHDKSLL